jgi:threonine/homoserine/homoserine lactone efflux protein
MNGALELLAFAGVMALGQFSPGPDMILLTRTALRIGPRAGVEMACGIACGLAIHTTLAVTGLALVLERFTVLWQALRWAAATYLLWLAYRIFMEVFVAWYSGGIRVKNDTVPAGRPWFRGFLCNLLNPKAVIFLAAVSAPFLGGDRPGWWPFAIWGIVVVQAAILWSLWACLLQWNPLRSRYERAARWIDGAFGVVLAALAVRLTMG